MEGEGENDIHGGSEKKKGETLECTSTVLVAMLIPVGRCILVLLLGWLLVGAAPYVGNNGIIVLARVRVTLMEQIVLVQQILQRHSG